MCGISGIVNGRIEPMIINQEHRGPDGHGVSDNEGVKIGHNRLSIIDLSPEGGQPMCSTRYDMTANCEIYNYKEMRFDLKSDIISGNDAKILLRYIIDYGVEDAIKQANGMFAIGVHDKKENKIHLAVDRFAQKPLYYYCDPATDTFAFASSPAALLHLKEKWTINAEAVQSYWKLGSVMFHSIWDGIFKVEAAEMVTYDLKTKRLTSKRYWMPQYQENTSGIEDLILDSIQKVKVADVPIFIFLSGGIDSTLVASQFEGGNAIHLESPEYSYAAQAAEKFNITLHKVTPAVVDPIAGMNDYVQKCGEPTMAGLIPWITSKEAVKFCKVAISANGADELFFGYNRTDDKMPKSMTDHLFRSCIDYNVRAISDSNPGFSVGRWIELMTYVQCDLNKTLDFASMAHSLEVRSPFLDHRLVEMALSINQNDMGRKQILKNMLHKMGFSKKYTDRPKMGFSLYTPVPGLEKLQAEAYIWSIDQGWLKVTEPPTNRDFMYLKASAFGFKQWYETHKHLIA